MTSFRSQLVVSMATGSRFATPHSNRGGVCRTNYSGKSLCTSKPDLYQNKNNGNDNNYDTMTWYLSAENQVFVIFAKFQEIIM